MYFQFTVLFFLLFCLILKSYAIQFNIKGKYQAPDEKVLYENLEIISENHIYFDIRQECSR